MPAIESLYRDAFPEENLLPLLHDLLGDSDVAMSLVATLDAQLAGQGLFTRCGITGCHREVALLGPLAVAPRWHRRGIGSAIVRAGMRRLKEAGVSLICVLGDPAYYKRFGFSSESLIEPPFPLPSAWYGAWQSLPLDSVPTHPAGKLSVPPPWHKPALWAP